MWATLLFGTTASIFSAMGAAALWHLRWVRRLPPLDTLPATASDRVRCSVVVAARDEEVRIEGMLSHLLAQSGVDAEFIIVNDRSRDRTKEILSRWAKQDSRIQVKTVDTLPQGWLGKCHACHLGASAAKGEWILFTDADCWLKPDVLGRALRVAAREQADHITLSPGTVLESAWARAWHLLFLVCLVDWFSGVNRDRPKAYMGIGAFNLVRAEAYRQCGGYEALRLTVVDDMKLGLLLRRAGKKTRAFLGVDDVECHWGNTVASMIRIMEKNYFAFANFRTGLVLLGTTACLLFGWIFLAGLLSRTPVGLAASLSPFALVIPAAVIARRVGWSCYAGWLVPFMLPVFLYALLNSTWVTLRQGGVRWRETFYPLADLRAGAVK